MPEPQYDLGAAELEILRALWDQEPVTVRDVLTHLHDRGRHVAYTTVQTLLTRMETKGYVTSDKSGQAFVYRSKVTRNKITRTRLKKVAKQLYDGAAGPLVLHLVRNERFTREEIDQLHELIDKLDDSQPPGEASSRAK